MKKYIKGISLILVIVFTVSIFIIPSEKTFAKSDLPEQAQQRLASAIVLYIGSNDAYINNVKTTVDKNIEISPTAENGRTLVPIRFIAESLGAKVGWEHKTSTITITYKGKKIKMVVGQKGLDINGKQIELEVAAKTMNSRTLVPFRAISEALGKKVFYDRGLIIISDKDNLFNPKTEKTILDGIISKVNNLPTVGSEAELKRILEKFRASQTNNRYMYEDVKMTGLSLDAMSSSVATQSNSMKSIAAKTDSASSDYSKTNVQVKGVDEADVVKTDGKYIYQVNKQRIVIADVYQADDMKVVSMVEFTDGNFSPSEIYVDGDRLVVIGSTNKDFEIENEASMKVKGCVSYQYSPSFVKALVYDISDKSNIKKIRDFEIEGNIVSSRRIGDSLYIVSNKYINYYYFEQNCKENITPMYYDSAINGVEKNLDYSKIKCIPHCSTPNYMVIAGINLNKIDEPANIESYLGSGDQIFVSENNLYVAVNEYEPIYTINQFRAPDNTEKTAIYKFSLDKGNSTYIGKGLVPGTILNQFSMDESDGNFRIATTTGYIGGQGNNISKNNLYILNDAMSQLGKIEDIAPGEKIYSVRFMGNRAYMVTFKNIDPLFVIDLKNPSEPKILGKLKIPGYSDYLHPYDENHIIGFGKDAVDSKESSFAWYQGLKIAMFDVTDVNNPKEMFKEIIGDRGTDSELLRNHKALLFSKEKNLLAFPVTLMEIKNKQEAANDPDSQYGEFAFQGAYVYNIDLKNGFQLKARISHISDEEYQKAGSYWYDSESSVDRILYISNTLYTLSQGMFKAHDLANFQEIGTLEIK